MGMFDYVKTEFELPVVWHNEWQSKSLDRNLDDCTITKNKTLIRVSRYADDENSTPKQVDFTGEVRFYDCCTAVKEILSNINNPTRTLSKLEEYIINHSDEIDSYIRIEYSAYFIKGKLQLLVLVSPWIETINI